MNNALKTTYSQIRDFNQKNIDLTITFSWEVPRQRLILVGLELKAL